MGRQRSEERGSSEIDDVLGQATVDRGGRRVDVAQQRLGGGKVAGERANEQGAEELALHGRHCERDTVWNGCGKEGRCVLDDQDPARKARWRSGLPLGRSCYSGQGGFRPARGVGVIRLRPRRRVTLRQRVARSSAARRRHGTQATAWRTDPYPRPSCASGSPRRGSRGAASERACSRQPSLRREQEHVPPWPSRHRTSRLPS